MSEKEMTLRQKIGKCLWYFVGEYAYPDMKSIMSRISALESEKRFPEDYRIESRICTFEEDLKKLKEKKREEV